MEAWNNLPHEVRLNATAVAVVGTGCGIGEAVYHLSGINGDSVGVARHLNAEINVANQDASTAQAELTALQKTDGIYNAHHATQSPQQLSLEEIESGRIAKDKTIASTLAKHVPHIPLSETNANVGSLGLAILAAFVATRVRSKRSDRARDSGASQVSVGTDVTSEQ